MPRRAGCGVALEVEEFSEAALHGLAEGNLREVVLGECRFRRRSRF